MNDSDFHNKKDISELSMICIAVIVGIFGGLGAVIFRKLVAFIYNLSFTGTFSLIHQDSMHAPLSIWGAGIILVPIIGSFIVTWLIENFASDEKGFSVSAIMYAVCCKGGKINSLAALAKILASSISIGTGGSIGREGPIAEIGAVISSILGDIIQLSTEQRIVLIAAGASAGTAAIFNAPFTGLVFAVELFLVSISISSIVTIAISTMTATFISYYFFGSDPLFLIKYTMYAGKFTSQLKDILCLIPCGILIGLTSALFIRGIYWTEDFFVFHFKNAYIRHASGMCLVGIIMYLLMYFSGHYYIEGIGFATIQDTLNFMISNVWLLIILFIAKFLATCLTLGSGASGGIFSPSLFLGATFGAAFGLTLHYLFPSMVNNSVLFVVVGMAALLGSVTGIILTAIILILEITRDYHLVLPIVITSLIASLVRKQYSRENVYTLKLLRQGTPLL